MNILFGFELFAIPQNGPLPFPHQILMDDECCKLLSRYLLWARWRYGNSISLNWRTPSDWKKTRFPVETVITGAPIYQAGSKEIEKILYVNAEQRRRALFNLIMTFKNTPGFFGYSDSLQALT